MLIRSRSVIINKLESEYCQQDIGLAFLYCSYSEHSRQTLPNLLSSLVRQLVPSTGLSDDIRDLYTHHSGKGTRPDCREYLKLLRFMVGAKSPVYLIIDALDEIDNNFGTRNQFIKYLQGLPNVHLLCTSRHVADIKNAFAEAAHLEIYASDADLKSYLEAQILEDACLMQFCEKDQNLKYAIVEKLTEKAQGM